MKNDTIMYGTISDAADVDYYTLDITESAEMLVSVTSDVYHGEGLAFEVINPSGNVILRSRYYQNDVFQITMGRGATAGKYKVRVYVKDSGEDWSDVDYELYFGYYKVRSDLSHVGIHFEFEPNDTAGYANYLPDYTMCFASISKSNDVDYYSFTLSERALFIAVLSTSTDYGKSVLNAEVFTADNKSMGKFTYDDDYDSFATSLAAGNYYIKVSVKDTSMKWDNELYCILIGSGD
jgi:hypothetical protein